MTTLTLYMHHRQSNAAFERLLERLVEDRPAEFTLVKVTFGGPDDAMTEEQFGVMFPSTPDVKTLVSNGVTSYTKWQAFLRSVS